MYLSPSFLNFSAFYEPKYPKAHQSYTWVNALLNMSTVCGNAKCLTFSLVMCVSYFPVELEI